MLERIYVDGLIPYSTDAGICITVGDRKIKVVAYERNGIRAEPNELAIVTFYKLDGYSRLNPVIPIWRKLNSGEDVEVYPRDSYGIGEIFDDEPRYTWDVPQKSH